jgi:hypothetical protein
VLKKAGRLVGAAGFDVKRASGAGVRRRDNCLTEFDVRCCLWSVIDEPLAFRPYFYVGRLTVGASLICFRSVGAEP